VGSRAPQPLGLRVWSFLQFSRTLSHVGLASRVHILISSFGAFRNDVVLFCLSVLGNAMAIWMFHQSMAAFGDVNSASYGRTFGMFSSFIFWDMLVRLISSCISICAWTEIMSFTLLFIVG